MSVRRIAIRFEVRNRHVHGYEIERCDPKKTYVKLDPKSTSGIDADGFWRPLKRHCKSPMMDSTAPETAVSNKFGILVDSDSEVAMDQGAILEGRKRSPPPIFWSSKANYERFANGTPRKASLFRSAKQSRGYQVPIRDRGRLQEVRPPA